MIKYAETGSWLHKADPRVKILWTVFISSALLVNNTLYPKVLVLLLLGYIAARVSVYAALKELKVLWPFIIFPIILHGFTDPGKVLIDFGLFDISLEGIMKGAQSSAMLMGLMLSSLLLIYTTETKKIQEALCWYRVPAKVVFMLTITLRFLPLVQEELLKIRVAQAARGHRSGIAAMLLPLLHKGMVRARKLAISMEARGFDPEKIEVRTDFRFGFVDAALLAMLAAYFAFLFLL